ncbi:MAG: hypothetical protein EAZ61_05830, partial [Oscillatoriales cyanobacterium]
MPLPSPSRSIDPWNFHALCAALTAEIAQGHWQAVSIQLKDWSAKVRGTFDDPADRQELLALGMALLQS